jgi:hypothetical protein
VTLDRFTEPLSPEPRKDSASYRSPMRTGPTGWGRGLVGSPAQRRPGAWEELSSASLRRRFVPFGGGLAGSGVMTTFIDDLVPDEL